MVFDGDIGRQSLASFTRSSAPRNTCHCLAEPTTAGCNAVIRKDPIRDGLKEGNAAYVGADDPKWTHLADLNDIDPLTYETSTKGLFAGGHPRNGKPSPVWEPADGKRAANSIDRYFQGRR